MQAIRQLKQPIREMIGAMPLNKSRKSPNAQTESDDELILKKQPLQWAGSYLNSTASEIIATSKLSKSSTKPQTRSTAAEKIHRLWQQEKKKTMIKSIVDDLRGAFIHPTDKINVPHNTSYFKDSDIPDLRHLYQPDKANDNASSNVPAKVKARQKRTTTKAAIQTTKHIFIDHGIDFAQPSIIKSAEFLRRLSKYASTTGTRSELFGLEKRNTKALKNFLSMPQRQVITQRQSLLPPRQQKKRKAKHNMRLPRENSSSKELLSVREKADKDENNLTTAVKAMYGLGMVDTQQLKHSSDHETEEIERESECDKQSQLAYDEIIDLQRLVAGQELDVEESKVTLWDTNNDISKVKEDSFEKSAKTAQVQLKLKSTARKGRRKSKATYPFHHCLACSCKYRVKALLEAHVLKKHPNMQQQPAKMKNVKANANLDANTIDAKRLATKDAVTQCKYCDKKFAIDLALQLHLWQHCRKIPYHAKRKLDTKVLLHENKQNVPVPSHSLLPDKPTYNRNTINFASYQKMKEEPMSMVTLNITSDKYSQQRAAVKTIPCHTCTRKFATMLEYTKHCMVKHAYVPDYLKNKDSFSSLKSNA